MTATTPDRLSLLRYLAVLAAFATAIALLPSAPAEAQTPPGDPSDACPVEPDDAAFTDRDDISEAHRANVDCAAHFDIVRGFADNTYRPRLQVRRDQMASFIALTLDAAEVDLPASDPNTFTDVGSNNVHADNINRLAAANIVEGGPLGRGADEYGPALRTRRDQMASFLMRAAGFALHDDVNHFDSTAQQFTDVPSGNVHFSKVNAAALNNIAQGVGGGQFAPRQETRRDQMASFVVRLLAFLGQPADGPVLDLAIAPTECVVGDELTATATLTVEGGAIEGEDIDFATTGTATTPETATATTDVTGEADFTFTVDEAGTATVTADFAANGQEASATADVTCAEAAEDTGVVVDVTNVGGGSGDYDYVPDGGSAVETQTYDGATDTFSVDGADATVAAFEAAITVGDRITVTGEDPTHHALVNLDPPEDGVIGNIDTAADTYEVIEPVSGVRLSLAGLDYAADCDLYEVAGATTTLTIFESHLNEGDILERSESGGLEVCNLTNQTVAGTVGSLTATPATPEAQFQIGNLGDAWDTAVDSHFTAHPSYDPNQTFLVDGETATRQEFVDAISEGDQASYTREAGVETFTLVNASPDTLSGTATDAFTPGAAADGGTFDLLPTDSATPDSVTYTAGARFIVDGLVATEAQFEADYSSGDDVSYTPADAPTSTEETVSLNNQDLTGIPEDIDTATTNTYDVENAAGGIIHNDLDYTAALLGTDRYFVDGSEVALAAFETALDDCAAATTNPCTIRVIDTALATEHRLSTG